MVDFAPVRIRPGAGALEEETIRRLHEIYLKRITQPGQHREDNHTVINELMDQQLGVMRQEQFMRGEMDPEKGSMPFVSDGALVRLAKDTEATKRLVNAMYAYDEAIAAAKAWSISQNGDYWTQATYRHNMEQMGKVGTRTGNVVQSIAQKRVELGLEKPGDRITIRFS